MRIETILIFCAIILMSGCLREDELKTPFATYVPQNINDGWALSDPVAENIDPSRLTLVYRDVHGDENMWQIRSLLVIRNGKLVAESYTKDQNDITTPRAIWSCTKQVVGILTGIALEQGYIHNINDPISIYLTDAASKHPDKGAITISNLLSMRSGIGFENDGGNGQTEQLLRGKPANSVNFIMELPMKNATGGKFHYNDGDPHLISAIIQSQTGKPLKDWAKEVLFSRLGIKNYDWVNYRDGVTFGGFGINITPREMAKIAQCVLNEGELNGVRVVSPEWISEITNVTEQNGFEGKQFGYQWWIDSSRGINFMWGHGGQFFFIHPGKQLIVAMTAEPNTQGGFQLSIDKAFNIFDRIEQAVY